MGTPKHRSRLGIAERTWRDDQRQKQTELLKSMYDRIDSDIADALGEDEESDDGTSQPQLR